ncbi:hypothetical protein KC354_g86 [Hortaea werneckii]|nr:hypothetical protein KC354_g86 [Hortaea werneckii]
MLHQDSLRKYAMPHESRHTPSTQLVLLHASPSNHLEEIVEAFVCHLEARKMMASIGAGIRLAPGEVDLHGSNVAWEVQLTEEVGGCPCPEQVSSFRPKSAIRPSSKIKWSKVPYIASGFPISTDNALISILLTVPPVEVF